MIHVGAWSLAFSCPRSILRWTAVGRNLAVTRTLGQTACREKHPQYSRALAIPLARRLHKIRVTGEARMVKSMKRPFVADRPVSEPGKYVEACTPKLPIRMVKLYALGCEP